MNAKDITIVTVYFTIFFVIVIVDAVVIGTSHEMAIYCIPHPLSVCRQIPSCLVGTIQFERNLRVSKEKQKTDY